MLPPELERLDALRSVPAAGLALVAAPVVLTNTTCRLFRGVCASYDSGSLTYAAFSWVTVGLLAILLTARHVPLRTLGMQLPTRSDCSWALAAVTIGIFGVYPAITALNALLDTPMSGMDISFGPGRESVAVTVFYAVITAPITEEILFRGFAMGYLLAYRWSVTSALVVPQLAFAAIHFPRFSTGGVIFISVWGLLPAVLRLYRGNLGASWLMHTLNNLFAYVVMPLIR